MRFVQKIGPWLLALAVATASFAQSTPTAQSKVFSNEQLDQMLAPIALYPDSLLAQVLMASTYPAQVKSAAAWSKANPKQQGDAAVTAAEKEGWDPAVTSLVAFPSLIQQMAEHPDDTQKIGDAFLAQPSDVMDSVQRLRAAAQKAGNLKTNEQQKVVGRAAEDHHRAGAAAGRLRADLQPGRRLWPVDVPELSTVLLAASLRVLRRRGARDRHRVGCGDRRRQRALGRLQLGRR